MTLTPALAGTTTPQGNTLTSIFGAYFSDPSATVGIADSNFSPPTTSMPHPREKCLADSPAPVATSSPRLFSR